MKARETQSPEYYAISRLMDFFEDLAILEDIGAVCLEWISRSIGPSVSQYWSTWKYTAIAMRREEPEAYVEFQRLAQKVNDRQNSNNAQPTGPTEPLIQRGWDLRRSNPVRKPDYGSSGGFCGGSGSVPCARIVASFMQPVYHGRSRALLDWLGLTRAHGPGCPSRSSGIATPSSFSDFG
jgi:hypothetical protein